MSRFGCPERRVSCREGTCDRSRPGNTPIGDPRGHWPLRTWFRPSLRAPGTAGPRTCPFQGEAGKVWNRRVSPVALRHGEGLFTDPTTAVQLGRGNGSSCPITDLRGGRAEPPGRMATCPWHPGFPRSAIRSQSGSSTTFPRSERDGRNVPF
jgi:hypothetical protein